MMFARVSPSISVMRGHKATSLEPEEGGVGADVGGVVVGAIVSAGPESAGPVPSFSVLSPPQFTLTDSSSITSKSPACNTFNVGIVSKLNMSLLLKILNCRNIMASDVHFQFFFHERCDERKHISLNATSPVFDEFECPRSVL